MPSRLLGGGLSGMRNEKRVSGGCWVRGDPEADGPEPLSDVPSKFREDTASVTERNA
jgi:hypothetical protein